MKKIIAFYDTMIYAVVSTPLIILSAFIFVFSDGFGSLNLLIQHWYLLLLFACGVVIPIVGVALLRYFKIENDHVYFHYLPLTMSWDKFANNVDICSNQEMLASEIVDIEIVKLTKEERETKVFYKHLFNRYLRISFKYGSCKYVYVGNYSNFQIKRIIKLLLT